MMRNNGNYDTRPGQSSVPRSAVCYLWLCVCVCVCAIEPSINCGAIERNVWLLTLGTEIAQVSPHFDAVINASIVFHLQQDEFQIPNDLYLEFVSMWACVCVCVLYLYRLISSALCNCLHI